jgi:hypothetical protein
VKHRDQSEKDFAFGPVCQPELNAIGIRSNAQIRELGWEEAYLRWVERFPVRINVNAAVAMIAAEQGIHWKAVSAQDKAKAQILVRRLRQQRSG